MILLKTPNAQRCYKTRRINNDMASAAVKQFLISWVYYTQYIKRTMEIKEFVKIHNKHLAKSLGRPSVWYTLPQKQSTPPLCSFSSLKTACSTTNYFYNVFFRSRVYPSPPTVWMTVCVSVRVWVCVRACVRDCCWCNCKAIRAPKLYGRWALKATNPLY